VVAEGKQHMVAMALHRSDIRDTTCV